MMVVKTQDGRCSIFQMIPKLTGMVVGRLCGLRTTERRKTAWLHQVEQEHIDISTLLRLHTPIMSRETPEVESS
jgi:hypothetical protein